VAKTGTQPPGRPDAPADPARLDDGDDALAAHEAAVRDWWGLPEADRTAERLHQLWDEWLFRKKVERIGNLRG
jgi:hypothetical protein